MFRQKSNAVFAMTAFVISLIFCPISPLSAQRLCCEGDDWLRWTDDHREDYVRGYILGRAEGYTDACYRMEKHWPTPITLSDKNNPLSKCLKEMPDFSRGPAYFARQVTDLYTKYPENRILLTTEVLEELGKGKTIQDIHQHPPFPADGASGKSPSGAVTEQDAGRPSSPLNGRARLSGPPGQCKEAETVSGATKYNVLLCDGIRLAKLGRHAAAVNQFVAASRVPLEESPNILLFPRLATEYATLGKTREAKRYLEYDELSVLWMLGEVRCSPRSSEQYEQETLVRNGSRVVSDEADEMSKVLCGEIFDDYNDTRNLAVRGFVPAAKSVLRHEQARLVVERLTARDAPAKK